ncbi:DUF4307 domain-containing protein [Isoptericola sp. b441]|uniref:DUF4307 domain-containing protein n=1 Tax=Actinotalea lenta TaxID=3064654 RepID=A0ABT9D7M1_9CELL|nr:MULTISPECIES: DUF4307 domain-containing protein [unclassified Isoptericola]MDO8106846.1 DUF4307 domain-containing protein [Isoptericola sp. b441]MDO8121443.1 DUF4307 domain-containing protein [Isoptericola sp. b490]
MSAPAPPEGRYGPAPSARRRRWSALAIAGLAVVGVAFVVWLGLINANPAVSWKDVGFSVDGNSSVSVTFDVMRADPSVPAQCRVQALNAHFAQVGVVTVDIPPGERGAQRHHVEVATSEEATTGVVDRCWVTSEG